MVVIQSPNDVLLLLALKVKALICELPKHIHEAHSNNSHKVRRVKYLLNQARWEGGWVSH